MENEPKRRKNLKNNHVRLLSDRFFRSFLGRGLFDPCKGQQCPNLCKNRRLKFIQCRTESGNARGAFLRTPTPVLDKIPGPIPVLPFFVFFFMARKNHPKITRIFIPTEPLQSLEKKVKTQKNKEFPRKGKNQGIQRKK